MYRETLKSNWKLLTVPVIVATAFAAWFTFGAAPSYRSSAAIWVDNGVGATPATAGNAGTTGPSALEDEVLTELLATSKFDAAVASRSQLARFMAAGKTAGGFSPAVLLANRHHSDDLAAASTAVASGITVTTPGPQVLLLSYDGPSPTVSKSVIQALIYELNTAGSKFGITLGSVATSEYERKLKKAMDVAQNTRGALTKYVADNSSRSKTPTYTALDAEALTAAARLASVRANLARAESQAHAAETATLAVLDPPSRPTSALKGRGAQVAGAIGGVFAGLVVSAVALILLANAELERWDAEMPTLERLAWRRPRPRASRGRA